MNEWINRWIDRWGRRMKGKNGWERWMEDEWMQEWKDQLVSG